MKLLSIILLNFLFVSQVSAMGWLGNIFSGNSNTEAGTCVECGRTGMTGRPLSALNPALAQGEGSVDEAFAHFELFARNNPECLPSGGQEKYGLITDFSNGTANNLTYVVKVDSRGKPTIVDVFRTAEGNGQGNDGVGNECGSNQSPHGFMQMGRSDYRAESTPGYPPWPQCGSLNPNFDDNRIYLAGLEPGYNDNLGGETNPRLCPDGTVRAARLHSITYATGGTSLGCKGMPLAKWCQWAPKLRDGCAYNYDGSDSPAICELKGGSAESCRRGSSEYVGS